MDRFEAARGPVEMQIHPHRKIRKEAFSYPTRVESFPCTRLGMYAFAKVIGRSHT